MPQPTPARPEVNRIERGLAAVLGMLLLWVAGAVIWILGADADAVVWALVALLAVLGAQAVVSAWQGRRSWLLRIGPLP